MNIENKQEFIIEYINELQINHRKDVLEMIYNSPSRNKIKENGSGTQIKLSDINDPLLDNIYIYIKTKLNEYILSIE